MRCGSPNSSASRGRTTCNLCIAPQMAAVHGAAHTTQRDLGIPLTTGPARACSDVAPDTPPDTAAACRPGRNQGVPSGPPRISTRGDCLDLDRMRTSPGTLNKMRNRASLGADETPTPTSGQCLGHRP
mmetsp:Transcript_150586/g.263171  ORF Transcript_150586/g.263171 Transcript_150586/m.263171 type:complete len:128 (+) Transcript_150586:736-1119(+)